ncbi:MAG: hypothetical protein WAM69_16985 [Candidatus Sulfotelmatobacter sp.]
MSAQRYLDRISEIISKIRKTQDEKIQAAAELFAVSIAKHGRYTCSAAAIP